jgi:3-hydroxy-9,10-secoandrosta-1,3,5(10)-triene-9,17-dione monooxygenase
VTAAGTSQASDRIDLVRRADELRPLLEANAAASEAQRRLLDETVNAIVDEGLIRLMVPQRFGGYETDFQTFLDVGAALGRGDGSAGWVASLYNISSWMVALFPEQAQADVWGNSPDVPMCSIVMPTSTARAVDGGLVVSGRWPFASGSAHAQWVLGAVPLTEDASSTALALIPMSEATIEDTWFVAGMRGTGSNTVVVDETFVPEHRLLPMQPAVGGEYRTQHTDEALYRSAFIPALAIVLTGAQIGMAQGALDFVRSNAHSRGITYTAYARQADSVGFQLTVAEAAARIDSAWLRAQRSARDIDEAARNGTDLDHATRGRVRMDTGHSARLCREAIDMLMSAYGTSAFQESNPLQRFWRDQATVSRHGFVNSEISQEVYGRSVLGVEETITDLL